MAMQWCTKRKSEQHNRTDRKVSPTETQGIKCSAYREACVATKHTQGRRAYSCCQRPERNNYGPAKTHSVARRTKQAFRTEQTWQECPATRDSQQAEPTRQYVLRQQGQTKKKSNRIALGECGTTPENRNSQARRAYTAVYVAKTGAKEEKSNRIELDECGTAPSTRDK